jgi:hypothetical protein
VIKTYERNDLEDAMRELVQFYGFEAVQKAMAKIDDEIKERSCSDDRPTPAWSE